MANIQIPALISQGEKLCAFVDDFLNVGAKCPVQAFFGTSRADAEAAIEKFQARLAATRVHHSGPQSRPPTH